VAGVLNAMGLRYFVTGSMATIFYGEPRFTNDIDVIVDLGESQIVALCQRFPPDEFYVSESAVRDAVRNKGQFNVIHPASGLKVDVFIPEATPFDNSRFARTRRIAACEDLEVPFASPEDVIIKKMEYYQLGGSEKHLRDIAGVLAISGDLDYEYVTQWAQTKGLLDVWAAIQERSRENG
jgi:hypothetical protein